MISYFKIYPTMTMSDYSVFRYINPYGKLVLCDNYQDLACTLCGKINEYIALNKGFTFDLPRMTNLDIFETFDHMMVISARMKLIIEQTCMNEVLIYSCPSTDLFFLMIPVAILLPAEGDSAFTIVGKCNLCGRYTEVVWGPTAPTIPEQKNMMAFQLESRLGIMPSWVVSKNMATVLKGHKPNLKGLIYDSLS